MRSFIQTILVAALFGIALAAPAPLPGTVPHENAATKHPRWAPESASGPVPSPLEARAVTKNHRRAPKSASGPVPSPLEARAVVTTKPHPLQARATQAAEGEYTVYYQGH
ncbi:hypothetical protein CTheo_6916 [Ceratobasidium theobromae]|uniref:Effector protein n=1 Tax=Ceratobasidium theobromae TaxID=1582974 RepID=A0A5N5QDN2_9AGAM|nr:hypothetical protein CTheo_6916 [Ceratobasidium theobromae]